MYQDIVIFAVFILIYSTVAGAVERTWISGAIIFTAFGLLIGPVGFDLISFKVDREEIRTLAELTLALVLFTDAAGADRDVLKKTHRLPTRLLLIGLPLNILLGFVVAAVLFQKPSLFEVALLATMLAPALADRNLDPDSNRCAGDRLFRYSPIDRRQWFYRCLQRRIVVRCPRQAAPGRISACGRRHRRYHGPDHLGDLRRGSGRPGIGPFQLGCFALCHIESDTYPHVAGVFCSHRFKSQHRG